MLEMQNCEAKITDIYLQSRMNKPTITEKLLYKKKKCCSFWDPYDILDSDFGVCIWKEMLLVPRLEQF